MPTVGVRGPRPLALLAFVAMLLSLVPVLLAPIPGFVDAPVHMARHHILAMAPLGGPLFDHFIVQWQWIANLGADIPAALLSRWLGGEAATRIVSALIAPLTIAGIVALSRAAHGRISASAMLALPFVFHQGWMYGFLNYGVGTGIALLVAARLLCRKQRSLAGQVGLAAASLTVCTAHLASWAILLLLAAGIELGSLRSVRDLWPALRRGVPLLTPLVSLVLWRSGSGGSDFVFAYQDWLPDKMAAFVGALRGTWMTLDFMLVMVSLVAAALALRASGRGIDMRLFCAGLLLTAATLAVPTYMLSSWAWGMDMRTAPFAVVVLILSIKPASDPRREAVIAAIGLSLFLVRLTSVTWVWAERSPALEQRLGMLDAVPRGGRLGYIWVPVNCDFWQLRPDEKLASYAVTRREAFVNTLFMLDKARVVTIRHPHFLANWASDSQRVSNPCPGTEQGKPPLDQALEAMRRDRFDAIWVSGVRRDALPDVKGYAVARSLPGETMLIRR
jgi:hypothetical protein